MLTIVGEGRQNAESIVNINSCTGKSYVGSTLASVIDAFCISVPPYELVLIRPYVTCNAVYSSAAFHLVLNRFARACFPPVVNIINYPVLLASIYLPGKHELTYEYSMLSASLFHLKTS